ncbi:CcdC protein domain-containing protein [Cohnella thailandensis]|uniref:Cytochrome c biogenesis protein CcdC n=1 Tax=Cohnella thailandensis TaxID=557557 RepID=A0A841SQZ7_9BACL|nr:CcdC protein domain-containing protein [Cohnella thailandensis]MBB6634833.1 cytochrome c biogenesis protein CcdC [Cohnella thailandensis]MBP1975946.1 membrane protein CcdC involved in cytochrome C biogenesis [Cohnella thailandensis]
MNSYNFYVIVILIAALILWRRTRSMYRPIKGNGIRLLVPAFLLLLACVPVLSTPGIHAAGWEWVCAFAFGAVLSIPLIWTTRYERRSDQQIYATRNKGFFIAFLIVFAVRFLLRENLNSLGQETEMALFLTIALGYALPWRVASFLKYRKLNSLDNV